MAENRSSCGKSWYIEVVNGDGEKVVKRLHISNFDACLSPLE
jgi:predicted methyltransferase